MSDSENVESLKVNGAVVTGKEEKRKVLKKFWEEIASVGEVLDVREGCVTLERKNAEAMNERISREEMGECVTREKDGKAAGPGEMPYIYKNRGEGVIDRMTKVSNQVWEKRVQRVWNEWRVTVA